MPLLSMMGAVLMAPLLPSMQAHFAGAPYATWLVPQLLTLPALCQALFSPLAGMIGDRFGARRMLLWSLALYAIAGTAPMYLETLNAIAVSRFVVGVAEAGLVTGSALLLSHYFAGDDRQKWFAYQNVVLPWLLIGLLVLTGRLGDFDWRAPFAAYAFSLLMLVLGVVLLKQEVVAADREHRGRFFPPADVMRRIVAVAVPGSIIFYVAPLELGFLLGQRGYTAPSDTATAIAIAVALGPFGPLLSRKLTHWPVGRLLALSMLAMGVGLIVLAMSGTFASMTAGTMLQQAGGGIMLTTGMTYFVSLAPPAERGRYAGAFLFCYMIAQSATPPLMLGLQSALGSREAAVLAAGVLGIAACAWLLTSRPLRRAVVVETTIAGASETRDAQPT